MQVFNEHASADDVVSNPSLYFFHCPIGVGILFLRSSVTCDVFNPANYYRYRVTENHDLFPAHRKSKRQKVVPPGLVGDYQCDKRFLTRAWEAHANTLHLGPNFDYSVKFGALSEKLQTELCARFFNLFYLFQFRPLSC